MAGVGAAAAATSSIVCGNKFSCLINWPTIFLSDIYLNLFLTAQCQINSLYSPLLLLWFCCVEGECFGHWLCCWSFWVMHRPCAQEFPSAGAAAAWLNGATPSWPEMPRNEIFADTKWRRFIKSPLGPNAVLITYFLNCRSPKLVSINFIHMQFHRVVFSWCVLMCMKVLMKSVKAWTHNKYKISLAGLKYYNKNFHKCFICHQKDLK